MMEKHNQSRWSNEEFYNPFGPSILQLKLDEELRLDLLNLVKNHFQTEWKENQIVHNQALQTTTDVQNATVSNGIWGLLDDPTWLQTEGILIQTTIENLLQRYNSYSTFQANTTIKTHIQELWYVIMKAGDFHLLHSHPTLLSGAIYLKVPESLPYPQGAITWIHGGTQQPLYNNTFTHSPEAGDVFLWPGWLQHMVYPFKQENVDRIMISFNGETDMEGQK